MKNFQTLKLSASSIGSAAPRPGLPAPSAQPIQEQQAPTVERRRPRASGLRKQMLLLVVVEAAATLAAIAATGSVHNTIFNVASAVFAITVALVVAVETAASSWRRSRPAAAAAPVAARPRAKKPFSRSRIALLMMMAIGFATYFGGGGTFSSFTAEDTNPNSAIASGTLTLNNTVNSGTTCYSYNGANNVNTGCDALFSLAGTGSTTAAGNIGPALYGGVAQVKVENSGSLDATKLELYAPSTTDCVSSKAASNQVSGATVGSSLTFNSGNICTSAIMYVQEVGTGHHYCWFGVQISASTCAAPFSLAYNGGATINGSTSSIAFTGTPNGNIVAGDKIHVSQLNASTQTYNVAECTASGSGTTVWMGDSTATSVGVGSCSIVSGVGTAFTSAATVTDYTTTSSSGPLSGTFAPQTISNFDTTYGTLATSLPMYPTTGDGTVNNSGYGLALPKYDATSHTSARTFYVGIYLPTPAATNQNTLQGLQATFSLTWHIEQ